VPFIRGTEGESRGKRGLQNRELFVKKQTAELSEKISQLNPNLHATMKRERTPTYLIKEKVATKYNVIYDIFGLLMESKARQRAIEIADIRNGEKVLEVAVGTGLNFVEILKRNPHGWNEGLDISPKMVKKARKLSGWAIPATSPTRTALSISSSTNTCSIYSPSQITITFSRSSGGF
jgi:hypothetical protein